MIDIGIIALLPVASTLAAALLAAAYSWPVRTDRKRCINRAYTVAGDYLGGMFAAFATVAVTGFGLFFLAGCSNSNSSSNDHAMLVLLFANVSALLMAGALALIHSKMEPSRERILEMMAESKGTIGSSVRFAASLLGLVAGVACFALVVYKISSLG